MTTPMAFQSGSVNVRDNRVFSCYGRGTQRQSRLQIVGSTISRMDSPITDARADKPVSGRIPAFFGASALARSSSSWVSAE